MEEILTKYKFDSEQRGSTSSVYGYKPDNKGMLAVFGEMYGVISLAVEGEFEVSRVMGLLLDELQESYFKEGMLSSDLRHFEASLRRMRKRLEVIIEREPELAESGLDMEAAFIVVKEDILYAAIVGESSIFVAREDEINEISGALVDPDQDKFMRTGSLRLLGDDRILIATDVVAGGNNEEAIVESLVDFTLSKVDIRRGAALLVGYGIDPELAAEVQEVAVEENAVEEPVAEEPAIEPEDFVDEETPTLSLASERGEEIDDWGGVPSKPSRGNEIAIRGKELWVDARARATNIFESAKEKFHTLRTTAQQRFANRQDQLSRRETEAEMPEQRPYIPDRLRGNRKFDLDRVRHNIVGVISNFKGNKTRYIIAGVVILAVVLGFAYYQETQRLQLQQKLAELDVQITDAGSRVEALVIDSGAVGNEAVGEKQSLVDRAKELNEGLVNLAANPIINEELKKKIDDYQALITPAVDEALRVSGFTQAQLVSDLGAKFQDAKPVGFALARGNLYVIDQSRNVLYQMEAGGTNADVAEVASGLRSPYLIDNDNDGNIVLVDQNAEAVIARYDTSAGSLARMDGLSRDKVGTLKAIDIWSNNRALYALSAEKRAVVRQDDAAGSFSLPDFNVPWRSDSKFADAQDIGVDGFIYVLIQGEGVQKYLSGQPGRVNVIGIMPEDKKIVADAEKMFLTERRVFVADSESRSIISLVKDTRNAERLIFEGKYEYRGSDQAFTDIRDIAVNESQQRIYVLEGNRVVRMSFASF